MADSEVASLYYLANNFEVCVGWSAAQIWAPLLNRKIEHENKDISILSPAQFFWINAQCVVDKSVLNEYLLRQRDLVAKV